MKKLHFIGYGGVSVSFMALFLCATSVEAESISSVLQRESIVSGVGGKQTLGKSLLDLSISIPTSDISEKKNEKKQTPRKNGKNIKIEYQSPATENGTKGIEEQQWKKKIPSAGKNGPFYIVNETSKHGHKTENIIAKNVWNIQRGSNLFNVLSEWTSDAGWSLVWRSDSSYQILSTATFYGDFSSAVHQLFSSNGLDEINIYVRFYTGNKVLLVTSEPF
ncbi:hypothetical protein HG772_003895 [Salmonella enterica]|nr:hypothetical protein [Salmonella enterica]ECZ5385624.1 hypothetical protein [Salmonella enterica subsp. enterica serovar Montevideo]EBR2768875.1 hypothetical protein [Salmonella enterica]EBR4274102.1 hypothetical protein [Salmonella enterica]ECF6666145.1 hypothetical protein [Salmonella enterica]